MLSLGIEPSSSAAIRPDALPLSYESKAPNSTSSNEELANLLGGRSFHCYYSQFPPVVQIQMAFQPIELIGRT